MWYLMRCGEGHQTATVCTLSSAVTEPCSHLLSLQEDRQEQRHLHRSLSEQHDALTQEHGSLREQLAALQAEVAAQEAGTAC